ncbi:polynucleotide adenylyltransferase PcnB [Wenzhouxiangella sp. XN79A]|uniref:polynucleotide adenylyltransferase PcnB n=1 Tax=Wenzhouxiangella sp. XN79A TaxID=2724193 RepID=UPI00144A7590|nr:polynucleotide adenylyltransferase PcnB [Wenzhouxiangella sp. XN79A]NKI35455.1 polynucleotide adenylyltransferase PcnB [Wenzhouxiangella sp. XN79A]
MSNELREIPRAEHGIARKAISRNALKVTETLQQAGFKAYIVGGAARDVLLGVTPKDFDVGTDATPEEVRGLFRSARLIGRRFRLAHVRFGREIIEVATFRGLSEDGDEGDRTVEVGGRVLRDNVFGGSEAEDARRRDFTANALMYDPSNETLRDYVGGYDDILANRLRLIGDPVERYREDPVRMLRAIRFVTKLGMEMDPATEAPIRELAPLLGDIPPARLLDELLKLLLGGRAWEGFRGLVRHGLWEPLFPDLLDDPAEPGLLIEQALQNTDERVAQGKPVTPGFLFASLFWPTVRAEAERRTENGQPPVEALAVAGDKAFDRYTRTVAVHRRFSTMAKEIWMFQPRFERRRGKRAARLLSEKRFRAAYDFLLLRALEDPALKELADWWTRVQEVDAETRNDMIFGDKGGGNTSRPPRKRKPRNKAENS